MSTSDRKLPPDQPQPQVAAPEIGPGKVPMGRGAALADPGKPGKGAGTKGMAKSPQKSSIPEEIPKSESLDDFIQRYTRESDECEAERRAEAAKRLAEKR